MSLLVPCSAPRDVEELGSRWYTWSTDAREHLAAIQTYLAPHAAAVAVRGPEHRYDWMYQVAEPLRTVAEPAELAALTDHARAVEQRVRDAIAQVARLASPSSAK